MVADLSDDSDSGLGGASLLEIAAVVGIGAAFLAGLDEAGDDLLSSEDGDDFCVDSEREEVNSSLLEGLLTLPSEPPTFAASLDASWPWLAFTIADQGVVNGLGGRVDSCIVMVKCKGDDLERGRRRSFKIMFDSTQSNCFALLDALFAI